MSDTGNKDNGQAETARQNGAESDSDIDLTRRGLFALAGVAGLGLATSGRSRAHNGTGTTGFTGFDTVHIVGDGDGMYQTIQEAHDALPGSSSEANGAILIADSYDSSDENFPVVVDAYADIRGMSNTGTVIYNGDSSKNTFEFTATEQHNTESPVLSNVRLAGGDTAIVVEGHVGMTVQDATIWASNTGIKVRDNSYSGTCYDNYFRNICISGVEGDGVYVPSDVSPHSLVFDNVNVYRAGQHGYQLREGGAGTTIQNSTIQHADDWGILVEQSTCFTVRDCYFENNGQQYASGSGAKIDICFHNNGENHSFLLQGCYFQGMSEGVNPIHINSGANGEIRNCHFNGYDGGYLIQDEGHTDLNVDRSTIGTDGSEASFYDSGVSQGTRTRENGRVKCQDLTTVEGKFPGDEGVHDGSGSCPEGLALWLDGRWVSQIDGSAIN